MASEDDGARIEQRLDALARANRLRTARANLKRRIAKGDVSCAELLLRPTWEIQRMPVATLLASQRYWGRHRCRRFLRSIQVNDVTPIGAMTERQRLAAVAALSSSGPRHAANRGGEVRLATPSPHQHRFESSRDEHAIYR